MVDLEYESLTLASAREGITNTGSTISSWADAKETSLPSVPQMWSMLTASLKLGSRIVYLYVC